MGRFDKFLGKRKQAPDFVGALRSVVAQVLFGNLGFVALQGLPRFGVTDGALVAWLRGGKGREALTPQEWEMLAVAEVEGVSDVAGEVVGELRGAVQAAELQGAHLGENRRNQRTASEYKEKPNDISTPNNQSPSFLKSLNRDEKAQKKLQEHLRLPGFLEQVQGHFSAAQATEGIEPKAKTLFEQGSKAFLALDLVTAKDCWTQAISIDYTYAHAHVWIGTLYKYKNDHELALKYCNNAIKRNSNFAYAYKERGHAYLDLKRHDEALADYSRALEIDPHYTYAYNGRGNAYKDLKRYEEALADYSKAIEIAPHYTTAYHNRGNTYKDLKCHDEALADYSRALEIDPHYTYAYNGRGIVYDDLKRYEEALADYSKAIEIDPRYSTAYHNRGVAYRNLKRYEEAIKNYDTAIELDPTDYFPWWNRGWAKYNTSGYEAALKDWQNALDEHIQTRMEPLGCAILHWSIGEAHSYRARDNTEYILYWEATQSYETAYNLIQADDHHTEQTLEILQSWLIVLRKLHNPIQRQKRTLDAIQRLNKAIQNADPSYRKLLCTKFFDFFTLEVDQLVRRENKPWPALAEAEKWKTLALQWLSNPQAEPQEHQTDLQTRVNDLCKDSHTAILYWHLSPAQITTFLLRPDAKPQVFATPCDPPATQTNFVEWLKQYKKLYEAQRQKKNEDSVGAIPPWLPQAESSAAAAAGVGNKAAETKTGNEAAETGVGTGALPLQGEPDWQTQLPGLLEHLAEILNIDEILPHLANIQHLILIPHRDLHLLPLHALFQSFPTLLGKEGVEGEDPGRSPLAPLDKGGEDEGFHITYLPQLTPLPLPPAPLPHSSPLQSLEPHSGLLFAEMECACLAALYPETQPRSGDAVILDNMQTLPPSRVLHFAGHGIHNTSSPHQSALELNGGEQLTLGALLDPENPIALPPYALVCLAACETGMASQGDFINEFVGFPGALLSTGTHQVLSTLWTVREDATALLIVEFFTRWQAGTPASAALHQTQIWLRTASHTTLAQWYSDWVDHLKAKRDSRFQDLRERVQYHREQPDSAACPYANPYYWAGFVLMGLDV